MTLDTKGAALEDVITKNPLSGTKDAVLEDIIHSVIPRALF